VRVVALVEKERLLVVAAPANSLSFGCFLAGIWQSQRFFFGPESACRLAFQELAPPYVVARITDIVQDQRGAAGAGAIL